MGAVTNGPPPPTMAATSPIQLKLYKFTN